MERVIRFDFKRLDVYQAALQHFGWCLAVAARIPSNRYVVTNQMLKAALSILLNLGEAGGRKQPGESAQYLRVAQGSVSEEAAMLDALLLMGVVDQQEYNEQEELLARVGSMITRMIQKKNRVVRPTQIARAQRRP